MESNQKGKEKVSFTHTHHIIPKYEGGGNELSTGVEKKTKGSHEGNGILEQRRNLYTFKGMPRGGVGPRKTA